MLGRSLLRVLLLAVALASSRGAAESSYVVPVRVSAPPLRFDYRAVTSAVILADFDLGADGRPRNLAVRHGNTHFLGAAVRAVESWRFELAEETVEHARIALVFLFRRP